MERNNEEIAVVRQCELLNLLRSSYYYSSVVNDDCNLELMRLIDEEFTRTPFYGVRRMTAWLRAQGYGVNAKRVRKLFRRLGLQAIYPHRRIGFSSPGHKLYPYLLEGVNVDQPNQVILSLIALPSTWETLPSINYSFSLSFFEIYKIHLRLTLLPGALSILRGLA
ncbi:MAG: IS3 family transposase [Acidobacteriota bacterium]|nr:IS3 family transposase [Acidobacteriota bacterium]